MTEQQIQKKIIDYLEKLGCICIKIITANKAGFSDIIACSPSGRFISIEVKSKGKKPTRLQAYKLAQFAEKNAIAFYADSFEMFLEKLQPYLDSK